MSKAILPGAFDTRARPTPRAPKRRYEAARRRNPVNLVRKGKEGEHMDDKHFLGNLTGGNAAAPGDGPTLFRQGARTTGGAGGAVKARRADGAIDGE